MRWRTLHKRKARVARIALEARWMTPANIVAMLTAWRDGFESAGKSFNALTNGIRAFHDSLTGMSQESL